MTSDPRWPKSIYLWVDSWVDLGKAQQSTTKHTSFVSLDLQHIGCSRVDQYYFLMVKRSQTTVMLTLLPKGQPKHQNLWLQNLCSGEAEHEVRQAASWGQWPLSRPTQGCRHKTSTHHSNGTTAPSQLLAMKVVATWSSSSIFMKHISGESQIQRVVDKWSPYRRSGWLGLSSIRSLHPRRPVIILVSTESPTKQCRPPTHPFASFAVWSFKLHFNAVTCITNAQTPHNPSESFQMRHLDQEVITLWHFEQTSEKNLQLGPLHPNKCIESEWSQIETSRIVFSKSQTNTFPALPPSSS